MIKPNQIDLKLLCEKKEINLDVKNDPNENVLSVARLFACVICLTPSQKFFTCSNLSTQHVVCNACLLLLRREEKCYGTEYPMCPFRCGGKIKEEPSLLVKKVFEVAFRNANFRCQYRTFGCCFQCPLPLLKKHEKNCFFQSTKCIGCGKEDSFWNIVAYHVDSAKRKYRCMRSVQNLKHKKTFWELNFSWMSPLSLLLNTPVRFNVPKCAIFVALLKPARYSNHKHYFPKIALDFYHDVAGNGIHIKVYWMESINVANYYRSKEIVVRLTVGCCKTKIYEGPPFFYPRDKFQKAQLLIAYNWFETISHSKHCIYAGRGKKYAIARVQLLQGGEIKHTCNLFQLKSNATITNT